MNFAHVATAINIVTEQHCEQVRFNFARNVKLYRDKMRIMSFGEKGLWLCLLNLHGGAPTVGAISENE